MTKDDDLEAQLLSLSEKPKGKAKGKTSRKKPNVEEEEDVEDNKLSALEREMAAAERYEQQRDEETRSRLLRKASSEKEDLVSSREMRKRGSAKATKEDLMDDLRKRRASAKKEDRASTYRRRDEEEDEEEEEEEEQDSRKKTEKARPPSPEKERKTLPTLTAQDMNSIRLKRDSLEKWLNEAYFDDIIKGFYVKVGLGVSNGKRVYRIGYIDEVKEDKKRYKVGKVETNKVLVLKYGNSVKNFRIEYVSNQDFSQVEVDRWITVMAEANEHIPTPDQIKERAQKLKEFLESYRYTNEDINKILEQKRKLKQIHRNLASEKISLEAMRDAMRDSGEAETQAEKFQEVLDRLEEVNRQIEQRKKDRQDSKRQIADINQRNRNVNRVAEALAREEESKFVAAHARRKTNPTYMFGAAKKKDQQDEDEDDVVENKSQQRLKDSLDDLDLKGNSSKYTSIDDIDIDFDIDVSTIGKKRTAEVLAPVTAAAPFIPTRATRPLKTLSVLEYKRRRGLI